MAKKRSSGIGSIEVDMTPMIDIVFQLIAFFMVINNFEQTQADERVKLPRDALAKPPEVKIEHEITLNVGFLRDMQGERTNPEPFLFNFGGEDMMPPLSSTKALEQEARLYRNREVEPKDVTIKVRADAEVPTGVVQELIKLAQDAGFEKFAMSAMSSDQSQ
jgi:biopolymer transport protein ExbD